MCGGPEGEGGRRLRIWLFVIWSVHLVASWPRSPKPRQGRVSVRIGLGGQARSRVQGQRWGLSSATVWRGQESKLGNSGEKWCGRSLCPLGPMVLPPVLSPPLARGHLPVDSHRPPTGSSPSLYTGTGQLWAPSVCGGLDYWGSQSGLPGTSAGVHGPARGLQLLSRWLGFGK